jgi:hypothetical protein
VVDIKPYVSRFTERQGTRDGWREQIDEETARRRGLRDYGGNPKLPRGSQQTELEGPHEA